MAMIKTTIHVCKKCRFSEWGNNANVTCGYYTMTGNHRNCVVAGATSTSRERGRNESSRQIDRVR